MLECKTAQCSATTGAWPQPQLQAVAEGIVGNLPCANQSTGHVAATTGCLTEQSRMRFCDLIASAKEAFLSLTQAWWDVSDSSHGV